MKGTEEGQALQAQGTVCAKASVATAQGEGGGSKSRGRGRGEVQSGSHMARRSPGAVWQNLDSTGMTLGTVNSVKQEACNQICDPEPRIAQADSREEPLAGLDSHFSLGTSEIQRVLQPVFW